MNNIKSIQVLGSNCPTCKKLYEIVKEAASELKVEAAVEYITDIQKIIDAGMMSSPALLINGQAVLAGSVPRVEKIKELLTIANEQSIEIDEGDHECSCCHHC